MFIVSVVLDVSVIADWPQVSTTVATKSLQSTNSNSPTLKANWARELAKLLVECKQEIPECLVPFRPQVPPDAPLFDDDDDDDEEADVNGNNTNEPGLNVAEGAAWDAGDNSVVFQGSGLRIILTFCSVLTHIASNEGSWGA
jgi:hypothetical protein